MDKNIGNHIFDYDLRVQESKKRSAKLGEITKKIRQQKEDIERSLNNELFSYKSYEVMDLMDISDGIKILIGINVSTVSIYKVKDVLSELFVVSYSYGLSDFEFKINAKYNVFEPMVIIYKDSKKYIEYDLKKEFIAFDFKKLYIPKFLENYIDLIIKEKKSLRLGMMLLAYYYLIGYVQYQKSDLDTILKMNSKEILELKNIFAKDLSTYIFDNHYMDAIRQKIDVQKIIDQFLMDMNSNKDHASILSSNKK